MELINLTPHPIHLISDTFETVEIPPSGEVARLDEQPMEAMAIRVDSSEQWIDVTAVEYGNTEGLPEHDLKKLYIVSLVVALAHPERTDLVFPYPLVRDDTGRVIGSSGFGRIG